MAIGGIPLALSLLQLSLLQLPLKTGDRSFRLLKSAA
jgi:hypothetical protein